jgi:hypothetical protein
MSTLFFEGFNQGAILNSLDTQYWSTQFAQFPKYGFITRIRAGFDPDDTVYSRDSPFGSSFFPPNPNTECPTAYSALSQLFSNDGNSYLCLYNPNYNDGTIEPPTFIRCSGFALPSGEKTYFSLKVYGLESNSILRSSYPHRNQFLSFCSGNNEILTFNMVRITGNFLPQLNGVRETLGIEAIYKEVSIGVFDMNIPNLSNYYIQNRYVGHNILNINGADTTDCQFGGVTGKRYIHLEFLLDNSINNSGILGLKIEGLDSPVINNNIDIIKSNWSTTTSGSGNIFFNNIKIYNRMTHDNCTGGGYDADNRWIFLDDIVLIDNSGNLPNSWLGPSSKIISYRPDASAGSGLFQWTSNVTTGNIIQKTQSSLYTNDGDIGYIETIDSGNVAALGFSKFTNLSSLPDGIGGIKIYNVARKESLDTQFINAFSTNITALQNNTKYDSLILTEFGKDKNDDDTITDKSSYQREITNSGCIASRDIIKNGNSSFYFPSSGSFIRVNHPFLENKPFTIECWKYQDNTDPVSLFRQELPDQAPQWRYNKYGFIVYPEYVLLTTSTQTDFKQDKVKLFFPSSVSLNEWQHIAVCRNSSGNLICYLNGVSGSSYQLNNSSIVNNSLFSVSLLTNVGDNFVSQSSNQFGGLVNDFTTIVGDAGYIDNFRITLDKNLYNSNFIPPSSIVLPTDYFTNLGPVHNVTQSSYKTFQYYSFVNPATNKNWRVSEISGMAFGVKKL